MRASQACGLALALLALPLAAGEEPDMELIEFLGEFTGADGEWVDPMDLYLLEAELPELLDEELAEEEDHEDR
ncbi:hypothetical protein [Natronospira bacteriovora]|uniref:Uncharacterized protein n=1 Tax=Natronospira bacteriovora TaxID=3069753 RepID=A0ABU0W7M5_9GAMM|nr:hypothetical protein [Natronospira sp. AB-CW4]MDQ2069929.1 hypothetical protein [Natronospira sp. AB-CW4]